MAPKTSEQYEEIRKGAIANIKSAALELFGTKGYHSTSISQIAVAAGVSKGLMYNYFDGKEALLREILMDAMTQGEGLMEQALSVEDPYDQLIRIVELSFAWITNNMHYWKLLTALAFQMEIFKGLEDVIQEGQGKAIGQTVEIFAKLGYEKPMEEALLFGAVMDGMMLHFMQMEDRYPMEAMKQHVFERFKPKKQS